MSDILISGGTIITVDEKFQIFEPGEVAIRGSDIIYVGPPDGTLPQDWRPERVINAENKLILPGFVNAHTHAAMTLFRGYGDDLPLQQWLQEKIWPYEAKLTAEDVYWGTSLAIAEMLLAGVTAFADMYFFPEMVARAVEESGIRATLALGILGVQPDANSILENGVRFCRQYQGTANGRIKTMLGPHAPYTCPPAFLLEVVSAAKELETGLHIHLAETKAEVEEINRDYGVSPVEYLLKQNISGRHILAAHCVHVGPEDIKLLAEAGVHVVHNPGSNLKLASGIAPVPQMLAHDICIALGTDGASSNNNLDLLEEARLAALIHKGATSIPTAVSAIEALKMATCNGAAAIGFSNKCGCIKPGWKADLIMLDQHRPHMSPNLNPVSGLIYSAQSSDVKMVIVDGKILVEQGEIKTLDVEKTMYMAEKQAKKLLGR